MEQILKIEIVENALLDVHGSMSGYKVTTDKQEIFCLIEDFKNCCESYGYLTTNDNLEEFIGAELKEIHLTDTALNNIELKEAKYLDAGEIQFVNLETSKGTLQFAVYNAHNGYYGHSILIKSNSVNEHRCI